MEKLGVDVETEGKTASERVVTKCPDCGSTLATNTNVPACPSCGTRPFEPKT